MDAGTRLCLLQVPEASPSLGCVVKGFILLTGRASYSKQRYLHQACAESNFLGNRERLPLGNL